MSKHKSINFYQYPPPIKSSHMKKLSLQNKLMLNKEMSKEKEFTLFISIPFCKNKCYSCPFFSNLLSTRNSKKELSNYLILLLKQIKNYAKTKRFSTATCCAVYIGGGTASLLTSDQVKKLVFVIKDNFKLKKDVEITLEGNPHDFNKDYLERIKKCEINRLSIGVQSFCDTALKNINAQHNSKLSLNSLKNASHIGFDTVNVDLLYGVPDQKKQEWFLDVRKAIELNLQSITVYQYVIHSGSSSEILVRKRLLSKQMSRKKMFDLYLLANEELNKAGYIEKRFGNFSKVGHEQKYSWLSYNLSRECIGIGAGAYSFINNYFFKTSTDISSFKEDVENKLYQIGDYISCKATKKNLMERYVINNLFSSIIGRKEFFKIFNKDVFRVFFSSICGLLQKKQILVDNNYIKLTLQGKKHLKGVLYEFYGKEFI